MFKHLIFKRKFKYTIKIVIAFVTTFCLLFLSNLFIEYRSDINSLGGVYYVILSFYSLINSLFVFLILKSRINASIKDGNWKIVVLVIWLSLCTFITDKIIFLIPKETTSDSIFYDVPLTIIFPYIITIIILLMGSKVLKSDGAN